jgi:Protein of unknown function (DUF2878)
VNLYNFISYQLAWFAVILSAAQGRAWAGIAAALLVTGVHLWLKRKSPELSLELKLIGAAALMGLVIDTTLAATAQVRFASAGSLPIAPFWMLGLWIAFATTLNHSLRWLMRRPLVAALGGAVFGPLAYLAGAKLGALSLPSPVTALPALAVLWAAAMSVFSLLMRPTLGAEARSLPA